jgi:hypothetical protein
MINTRHHEFKFMDICNSMRKEIKAKAEILPRAENIAISEFMSIGRLKSPERDSHYIQPYHIFPHP